MMYKGILTAVHYVINCTGVIINSCFLEVFQSTLNRGRVSWIRLFIRGTDDTAYRARFLRHSAVKMV